MLDNIRIFFGAEKPHRLPSLNGSALLVYRVTWSFLFMVLAFSCAFLSYKAEIHHQSRLRQVYSSGLLIVGEAGNDLLVAPHSESARLEGVVAHDRLSAINGIPVGLRGDFSGLASVSDGGRFSASLRHADGRSYYAHLVRSSSYLPAIYAGSGLSFEEDRWISFSSNIVAALVMLLVAILLFMRRPKDPVAALISLGFMCNALAMLPGLPNLISDIRILLLYSSFVLFFFGILVFPSGRFEPRWTLVVAALISLLTVYAALGSPHKHYTIFYSAGLSIYGLSALSVIVRYRSYSSSSERQQIKFAMFGFVINFILNTISYSAAVFGQSSLSDKARIWSFVVSDITNSSAAILIALGLLVSLMRFRLYDADILIGRSVTYSLLTLALGITFAGTEKAIEVVSERVFGSNMGNVSAGIGAAMVTALIAPLHHLVRQWTERRFHGALASIRSEMPSFLSDLREFATPESLVETVIIWLEHGVRASRSAVLISNDHGHDLACHHDVTAEEVEGWQRHWLPRAGPVIDCDPRDELFPLRLALHMDNSDNIGWILLGPRPDGSFYGKEEREALAGAARPIARSIYIVRRRCAEHEALEARLAAIEARLSKNECAT